MRRLHRRPRRETCAQEQVGRPRSQLTCGFDMRAAGTRRRESRWIRRSSPRRESSCTNKPCEFQTGKQYEDGRVFLTSTAFAAGQHSLPGLVCTRGIARSRGADEVSCLWLTRLRQELRSQTQRRCARCGRAPLQHSNQHTWMREH